MILVAWSSSTCDGAQQSIRGIDCPSHWAKTNMTPIRGWSRRGDKLVGRAPFGRWRTLTFLAALRHDRIDAPCVLDGPINGQLFTAYVEQFLVPSLSPGDIVIMDNLGSHKGKAVRKAIRGAGAKLLFLPPTRPTSIRSNKSSPSSSCCFAKPPNEPPRPLGNASDRCSTPSRRRNAPTTCETQATLQYEEDLL